MKTNPRILSVLDLHAQPERICRIALAMATLQQAALSFVTLFDHPTDRPDPQLSCHEQFQKAEQEQQHTLHALLVRLDAEQWPHRLLCGDPNAEVSRAAQEWQATLILADTSTARTLYNGWLPWHTQPVPLPCPLRIINPSPALPCWIRHLWGQIRIVKQHPTRI
ncbi:MAG: universal stress protein [Magnetococcales bacterium]|nr:universal stress protein [Magnetococcales bacterium]